MSNKIEPIKVEKVDLSTITPGHYVMKCPSHFAPTLSGFVFIGQTTEFICLRFDDSETNTYFDINEFKKMEVYPDPFAEQTF